ncbi:MAG: sulfatase [Planctomycetales bacterium]|nr:sulfatase [Planctomycetales bacterium]
MRTLSLAVGILLISSIGLRLFAQPMNLLIIQTDEHNFRTLGCYRDRLSPDLALVWGPKAIVETPHIDSIARRGLVCTSFYATSPVCTPSRAALVSGRYPQNTDATTNDVPMRDSVVTFAEHLRRAGYSTGFAGKWHLDGPGKPQWEPARKFGFVDNRYMFNRGHWKKLELSANGPRVGAVNARGEPSYDVDAADSKTFTTDWLTDRALEFISANHTGPFCYMLSIPDPHGPNTVRSPYDEMYDPAVFQRPKTFTQSPEETPRYLGGGTAQFSKPGMAKYFGMVKCIDDNVGRLLKRLEELNILDRTMIVFTSDHGDLCGEHHRDNKGNPYEGSARVPMIVAGPTKVAANATLDIAMTGVDFSPTILKLLGQILPEDAEGRDLSEIFKTGQVPENFRDVAFMRKAGRDQGWIAALTDRYKLVLSPEDEPWLFDLTLDPDELLNFYQSPQHRTTVKTLAKAISEYGLKHNDPYVRLPKIAEELTRLQLVD